MHLILYTNFHQVNTVHPFTLGNLLTVLIKVRPEKCMFLVLGSRRPLASFGNRFRCNASLFATWEGNVFSRVCSEGWDPMWPLPIMHWTLLYRALLPQTPVVASCWNAFLLLLYSNGSRIFLRGVPTPKVGVLTYFLPKTAWKWTNLDPRGCVSGAIPLDPPLLLVTLYFNNGSYSSQK